MALRTSGRIVIGIILLLIASGRYCYTQISRPEASALQANKRLQAELAKLPVEVRERAKAVLDEIDERKRAALAASIARRDPETGSDFLIALISAESSANVRYAIVDALGWHSSSKVRAELSNRAGSDPDVRVALLALERLRFQLMQDQRELLSKRLNLARQAKDEAAVTRLLAEQERWISLTRGTMLPGFLRASPPRFSIKPDGQTIRVVAFGDFGTGSPSQRQVASVIGESHRHSPFDFGITLGDNFYVAGMSSPSDPRWKTQWEDLYGPLGVRFYATFGNHDWVMSDSPAAEILYSDHSPSWRMPAPYYTFTAGSVQFFALDTNEVSEAQLIWLDSELKSSTARWKVVYAHHPIYSDGEHGDNAALKTKLLPILMNRVDVYLAGHDHMLNHIKAEGGVHFFVSGGGGAGLYKVKTGERTLFAESKNGFSVLEAGNSEFKITYVGVDGKPLYEYSLHK